MLQRFLELLNHNDYDSSSSVFFSIILSRSLTSMDLPSLILVSIISTPVLHFKHTSYGATIKMGIFYSSFNLQSSHSVSCIYCPKSLSLRILTFLWSQEKSRGAELSAFDPTE